MYYAARSSCPGGSPGFPTGRRRSRRPNPGGRPKEDGLTEIKMPKPGEAIEEALFAKVLVPDGTAVNDGDDLYEIETDKVEMVITAPASGVVRWSADEGETYEVGTVLGVIE
jgi:biotin carboxyl carrier protein